MAAVSQLHIKQEVTNDDDSFELIKPNLDIVKVEWTEDLLDIKEEFYSGPVCVVVPPSLRDIRKFWIDQYRLDSLCVLSSPLSTVHNYYASIYRRLVCKQSVNCHLCNCQCIDRRHLIVHMRKHTSIKTLSCDKCNYHCGWLSTLEQHKWMMHTQLRINRILFCSICQKRYPTQFLYLRHMRIKHSYTKLLQNRTSANTVASSDGGKRCLQCNQCFRSDFVLNLHKFSVHVRDKLQKSLLLNSGNASPSKTYSNKNRVSPIYQCRKCEQPFRTKWGVSQHTCQSVIPPKSAKNVIYICIKCHMYFACRDRFVEHMRIVHKTSNNPVPKCGTHAHQSQHYYLCKLCTNAYESLDLMVEHTTRQHTQQKSSPTTPELQIAK